MPAGRIAEERGRPLRLPDELLAKSGFLMVRLGMAFKMRAIQELEAAGFSQYHYSVLAMLGEQPRKTQSSVADALGVDPSQLVGILDGLEERGLIARQRDPDDRRRHVVSLTTAGRRQLLRLRATFERPRGRTAQPAGRRQPQDVCTRCCCASPATTTRSAAGRPRRRPALSECARPAAQRSAVRPESTDEPCPDGGGSSRFIDGEARPGLVAEHDATGRDQRR